MQTVESWDSHFKIISKRSKFANNRPFDADFGTVAGQQSLAEVKDLIALYDYRIQQLQDTSDQFQNTWQSNNANDLANWNSDFTALKDRYGSARDSAQLDIDSNVINPIPDSMIAAQSYYDDIMLAVAQGYQTDGGGGYITQTGDWKDLYDRLNAATSQYGGNSPQDQPPQPQAADYDQKILQGTAGWDLLAQMRGDQAPTSTLAKILKWLYDHPKTAVTVVVLIVGYSSFGYVKGIVGGVALAAKPLP